MKKSLYIFMFLPILMLSSCNEKPLLKIACVGDSLTYGLEVQNPEKDSYPSILETLMGDTCQVKNFGFIRRTLLSKGDHPYINEKLYQQALEIIQIEDLKLG